jgi:transposase-like protein
MNNHHFTAEHKLYIVLKGFRHNVSVTELCRQEGIPTGVYYRWRGQFLQGVRTRAYYPRLPRPDAKHIAKLRIENRLLREVLKVLNGGKFPPRNQTKPVIEV